MGERFLNLFKTECWAMAAGFIRSQSRLLWAEFIKSFNPLKVFHHQFTTHYSFFAEPVLILQHHHHFISCPIYEPLGQDDMRLESRVKIRSRRWSIFLSGNRARWLKPQVENRCATGRRTQTAVLPAACGLGRVQNECRTRSFGRGSYARVLLKQWNKTTFFTESFVVEFKQMFDLQS